MKPEYKKARIFAAIALIIILGFIAYANSLNGKFIRDDNSLIRDNIYIKSQSKVLNCFTKNIAMGGRQKWNSYRPLQMITYMIDYSIWGLNVKGYHLTNILLHIFVALTIFWLVTILYDDWLLSLFTSLLFVVHPIHTGAVAYISGRADSLSALFMLLCFIFYLKLIQANNIGIYTLMLLSYVLALLSKENSLILPLLLLLYHYAFKKKIKLNNFLPLPGIAFIYILLRVTVLRSLLFNIPYTTTLVERIPGFFVAITNYTRLMLLPFNLHAGYGVRLFNLGDPKAIAGILISAGLLIYAFRKRNTNSLLFFAIYWLFIALLPQSNLYPINAYMAEHWLYLPSIGFFLILAKGLSSLYKTKQFKIFSLVFMIILLGFYVFLTIRQNEYWREPIAFYKRTLKYAPDNFGEYNNLGLAYDDIGKKQEAIASYKQAIELDPGYVAAYNNLGNVYDSINKREEAIALFKQAIKLDPSYEEAYYNLGNAYIAIHKSEEAIASYKKAIELNPDLPRPYNNLANAYLAIHKNEEAIALYKQAIELDPSYAETYHNLGNAYKAINKEKEAADSYKKALELNPDLLQPYKNQ